MRLAWSTLGATLAIVSATPLRGSATSGSPTRLKKPIHTKSMMIQKAIRAATDRTASGAPGFVSPRASAVRRSRLVRTRVRLRIPAATLATTYPTRRMPRPKRRDGRAVAIRCTDGPRISANVMGRLPWCGRWSTSRPSPAVSPYPQATVGLPRSWSSSLAPCHGLRLSSQWAMVLHGFVDHLGSVRAVTGQAPRLSAGACPAAGTLPRSPVKGRRAIWSISRRHPTAIGQDSDTRLARECARVRGRAFVRELAGASPRRWREIWSSCSACTSAGGHLA